MTKYSVLLLPFVALVILIFLTLFFGGRNISKKFQNPKRRKIWLGRLAVFMLLLSTGITLVWPMDGTSGLVQGLLITALGMFPAIVFHLLASHHYGSPSIVFSLWSSFKGQFCRFSKRVQSHVVGGHSHCDEGSEIFMVGKPIPDIPQEVLGQSIDTATDSTALSAMSTQQLSSLVTSLKEEKGKLQKLVIAQHAVIESEREANVRNRGLARDAIELMHRARNNQKLAEKMARREHTERQG